MVSLVKVKQDDEKGIAEAVRRAVDIVGGLDDIVKKVILFSSIPILWLSHRAG